MVYKVIIISISTVIIPFTSLSPPPKKTNKLTYNLPPKQNNFFRY